MLLKIIIASLVKSPLKGNLPRCLARDRVFSDMSCGVCAEDIVHQFVCPTCPRDCSQCGPPASEPGACHCGSSLIEKKEGKEEEARAPES